MRYQISFKGVKLYYMPRVAVEQNPECWRKVDEKYPCKICNVTFCYHNSPPEEREVLGIKVKINDKMQPGEWGLVDEKGKPMYHSIPDSGCRNHSKERSELAEQKRQESIALARLVRKLSNRLEDNIALSYDEVNKIVADYYAQIPNQQ